MYIQTRRYPIFFRLLFIAFLSGGIGLVFFTPHSDLFAAQCPNGQCPADGVKVERDGAGKDCDVICTDILGGKPLEGKICSMDDTATQTICCCKKSASSAPALAPTPTTACNKLTHSEAGAGKCGDICRANNPSKWGDGSYGGGDICCCTSKGSGRAAAGGGSSAPVCSGGTCSFPPPLGTNIPTIVGGIIKAIIGVVGSFALLMFVWGGFLWLTAAGEEKRIKDGRSTMTWATLGMLAIFGAYAIAEFLVVQIFSKSMK